MRLLKYFFHHSFFVAFCAASLTSLTYHLQQQQLDLSVIAIVFFSTLGAYNFYWLAVMLLSDKVSRLPFSLSRYLMKLIWIFLSFVAVFDYIWYRLYLFGWMILPIISTLMYTFWTISGIHSNRQHHLSSVLGKTFLLSLTWTFTTVLLPNYTSCAIIQQQQPQWVFFSRLFFLWMLCIIFEMKDAYEDVTLQRNLFYVMFILLVLQSFFVMLMPANQFFIHVLFASLAFLLFILSWTGRRGYLFYYLGVDGLMLLYAFSLILTTI